MPPQKTLRDEIAIAAIVGVVASGKYSYYTERMSVEEVQANHAYKIADAMLAEKDKFESK